MGNFFNIINYYIIQYSKFHELKTIHKEVFLSYLHCKFVIVRVDKGYESLRNSRILNT